MFSQLFAAGKFHAKHDARLMAPDRKSLASSSGKAKGGRGEPLFKALPGQARRGAGGRDKLTGGIVTVWANFKFLGQIL
jgi:hypothetical protein